MDRHNIPARLARLTALFALLVLGSSGCRTPRSEVPPGKPYQTTGNPPTVGFSSDPHQAGSQGMAGLYPNRAPGAMVPDGQGSPRGSDDLVIGTPTPGSSNMGAPSDHRYGAPGTSGSRGTPSLANSILNATPPASEMLKKDPEATPTSGVPSGTR
ncbi:MAG: hypothetical protein U0790_14120 [Isosphaeraceae bacterium]